MERSLVRWFPDKEDHACGYCKSPKGNISYGMWAQSLTVADYQILIDRGWRRSGRYCYKPILKETCCPLYTIRCHALELSLSKSQKKVIKKLSKFLNDGVLKERKELEMENPSESNDSVPIYQYKDIKELENPNESYKPVPDYQFKDIDVSKLTECLENSSNVPASSDEKTRKDPPKPETKTVRKGLGADPEKPPKKKSKLLRMERKLNKPKEVKSVSKSLEDFMNEVPKNAKHKLTVKLIQPKKSKEEWKIYEKVEFELFRKYQTVIHNEAPEKNTLRTFSSFLVDSPLRFDNRAGTVFEFGSYHQQYWLDDKLIAVGVIDILPKCISAVYFFYDPDYRELSLGTYGALKEIQLTRSLHEICEQLKYYYMGFYIHSCPKMRYKGRMEPSYLLCPETYVWFPIERCLPKIEASKYSRFNENPEAKDIDECYSIHLENIRIVFNGMIYPYRIFRTMCEDNSIFENIGKLCGKKVIGQMFFVES